MLSGLNDIYKRMLDKEKLTLLLVFSAALFLRLLAVINLPVEYRVPQADAAEYHQYGVNLLTGRGFVNNDTGLPTSRRPPLYPLFLAVVYCIFGVNYFAVRFIQCIIGALLCIIIFHITKIIFDKKIAILSALLLAFYPPYIRYLYFGGPAFLLSENIFSLLFALFIFYLMKSTLEGLSFRGIVFSGVFFGLATLSRPEVALFPIFLTFFFINIEKGKILVALKKIFVFFAAFLAVISPWALRNYFVHKAFVPISTLGGYVFWCGNNPQSRGSWGRGIMPFNQNEGVWFSKLSELQQDRLFYKGGTKFLFENYKKAPRLFFKKILVFWNVFNEYNKYNIWFGIALIFGLFGIFQLNNMAGRSLFILIFLYLNLITLIFYGDPRYRYCFEPYLLMLSSAGITAIYNNLKRKALFFLLIFFVLGINTIFYIYSDKALYFIKFMSRGIGLSW